MKKLILATNNRHKIVEIKEILQGIELEILSVSDFDDFPEIEETGKTLPENAILKARTIWNRYRLPCLADDTGLEVDYLDGAPGVYSSRFAGEGCSYDDNNKKLLSMLEGIPSAKRTARFKTVIAFADIGGEIHTVEGILEGIIGTEPKGTFGFGYDPVFVVGGMNVALAELSLEEKNRISHRGRALAGIKPIIIRALNRGVGSSDPTT
ncbi:MAG: RdgB/HAM1 family non-canonical purine NTP pyrophosphatase [candidate division Zixibacteria bacterium]